MIRLDGEYGNYVELTIKEDTYIATLFDRDDGEMLEKFIYTINEVGDEEEFNHFLEKVDPLFGVNTDSVFLEDLQES